MDANEATATVWWATR